MAPTSTASAYLDHPSRTPRTEPTCVFNGAFAVRRCDLRVSASFDLCRTPECDFSMGMNCSSSAYLKFQVDFIGFCCLIGHFRLRTDDAEELGYARTLQTSGSWDCTVVSEVSKPRFDLHRCHLMYICNTHIVDLSPLPDSLSLYYCIYECCAPCILCILISIYNTWCTYCILWNYTPIHTYYIYNICIKKYISYYSMQRKGIILTQSSWGDQFVGAKLRYKDFRSGTCEKFRKEPWWTAFVWHPFAHFVIVVQLRDDFTMTLFLPQPSADFL